MFAVTQKLCAGNPTLENSAGPRLSMTSLCILDFPSIGKKLYIVFDHLPILIFGNITGNTYLSFILRLVGSLKYRERNLYIVFLEVTQKIYGHWF